MTGSIYDTPQTTVCAGKGAQPESKNKTRSAQGNPNAKNGLLTVYKIFQLIFNAAVVENKTDCAFFYNHENFNLSFKAESILVLTAELCAIA